MNRDLLFDIGFLLFTVLASSTLAWSLNRLSLRPWRRSVASHWTERARLLYPARMSRQVNLLTLPLAFFLLSRICFDPSPPPWQLVAACSLIGAFLGNYPMDRETHGGWAFRAWLHYCAVLLFLQFTQWILLFVAIEMMPRTFNLKAGLIAGAFAAASLLLTFGLGLRVLRLC